MFYVEEEKINYEQLRFGDVIVGNYLSSVFYTEKCIYSNFQTRVNILPYNVILTPCCSIQTKENEGNLIVTPLIQISPRLFSIKKIRENCLIINKLLTGTEKKEIMPQQKWDNLSIEQQTEILNRKPEYEFKENFIYDTNPIFDKYSVDHKSGKIEDVSQYMIDFRNIYNIKVENIKSPKNIILSGKKAELTATTRGNLNDKLQAFFRIAKEDLY